MYTPNFKPSEVIIAIPPLCDTMNKAEIEHAATLYVCACRFYDDKWLSLSPEQMEVAIEHDIEHDIEPLKSLNTNPFFCPCMRSLIDSDYGEETSDGKLILTQAGFDAIQERWVPFTT